MSRWIVALALALAGTACMLGTSEPDGSEALVPVGDLVPVPVAVEDGAWAYILEPVEGDEDVLVRIGDLEIRRGEVRQATQKWAEITEGGPVTPEIVDYVLKLMVQDLALYSLAIDRGLQADNEHMDDHVEVVAPPEEYVARYGITRQEFINLKYEDYRRVVSIGRLMKSQTDTEDPNLESLIRRGLLREALSQRPLEWLDKDMQRVYEGSG